MKLTFKEIVTYRKNLMDLVGRKFPPKLAYSVVKNIQKFDEEVKILEKQRMSLVVTYAEKDENGNLKIKDACYVFGDNMDKFSEEYNEYLDTEIEVDIHVVSMEEIEKTENERYDLISFEEIRSLAFMIKE